MFKPPPVEHNSPSKDRLNEQLTNLPRKKTTSFFDTTELDKVNKDLPEGVRLTRHKAQSLGDVRLRKTPPPPKEFQIPLANRFAAFQIDQTQPQNTQTTSTPNTDKTEQITPNQTQSAASGSSDKTVSLDSSFFNNFITSAERAWRKITRVEIIPVRQPNLDISNSSAESNITEIERVRDSVSPSTETTNIPVASGQFLENSDQANSSQIENTSKTSGVYSSIRLDYTQTPKAQISPIPIDPNYSPDLVKIIEDFNMAAGGAPIPQLAGNHPGVKHIRLLDRDFEIQNYDTTEVLSHFVTYYNKIKTIRNNTNNFMEMQLVDLAETVQQANDFSTDMHKIVRWCIINNIPTKDFELLDGSMGQMAVLADKRLSILRLKEAQNLPPQPQQQAQQPQVQQQVQIQQHQNIDQQSVHSQHSIHSHHSQQNMPQLPQIAQQEIAQQQANIPQVQVNNPNPAFTMQDRYDLDDLYHQFDAMRERIDELEQEQKLTTTPTQNQNFGFRKRPPHYQVKPFKGDKKDYLRFKTTFKDMYEDTGLPKVSLAIHLGDNLEGEIRQKFAYMIATADENTYDAMWRSLDTFYGKPKIQALEKLDRFTSMPPIRSFNATTISMLITTLEEHWELLKKSQGESFSKEDNLTFFSFLRKIPLHEVAKYKEFCRAVHSQQTFETFKDWLDNQWEIWKESRDKGTLDKALQFWQKGLDTSEYQFAELAQSCSRQSVELNNFPSTRLEFDEDGNAVVSCATPQDETHVILKNGEMKVVDQYVFSSRDFNPRGRGGYTRGTHKKPFNQQGTLRALPAPNNSVCPHCKEKGHMVYKCPKFNSLDVKDRYISVKENNLCVKCLCQGHMARDCSHKFVCNIDNCGKNHNKLLHTKQTNKLYLQLHFLQGLEDDIDSDTEINTNQN